jgi:hypothetical protein
MSEEDKVIAMQELIKSTYEAMGVAVLNINPFAPGVFKLEVMNMAGLHEAYVTVLLHMTQNNVTECKRFDASQ